MTKWPEGEVSNYRNAMEPLIIEELELQLQNMPAEEVEKINKAEAIAYSLNRLPVLYATTQEGWDWQQERARESFPDLIAKFVSRGILRSRQPRGDWTTPLPKENTDAEIALEELKKLLVWKDLSWENLVEVVEETLLKTAEGKISWHSYLSHKSEQQKRFA